MREVKVIGLFNLCHTVCRTGRVPRLYLKEVSGSDERPPMVKKFAHPLFCRMFGDVQ